MRYLDHLGHLYDEIVKQRDEGNTKVVLQVAYFSSPILPSLIPLYGLQHNLLDPEVPVGKVIETFELKGRFKHSLEQSLNVEIVGYHCEFDIEEVLKYLWRTIWQVERDMMMYVASPDCIDTDKDNND